MDNGPEMVNNLVTEVLQLLGTTGATILAYSKEENAIVERANKEVMRHLRALIFEKANSVSAKAPKGERRRSHCQEQ
jgi:hypothetical protein